MIIANYRIAIARYSLIFSSILLTLLASNAMHVAMYLLYPHTPMYMYVYELPSIDGGWDGKDVTLWFELPALTMRKIWRI